MPNEDQTKEYVNKIDEADEPSYSLLSDVDKEDLKGLPVGRQLILVGAILVGVFSLGAIPYVMEKIESNRSQTVHLANTNSAVGDNSQHEVTNFEDISIGATSAFVYDVRKGEVLYQKDPDKVWPLASITKLMTALVAREVIEEGAVIPMTEEALKQSGDSGLSLGERFTYRRLSDLVLMTSSNDGAYALAYAAGENIDSTNPASSFVKAMNVRAKEIGLTSTYFRNPTGLDISETEAGAYGTAKEVSKLMEYLLINHPDILEETTKRSSVVYNQTGGVHEAENTNRIIDAIATVIGSKTGYTTLSGGNLVVAFNAAIDRPIIVVVLGSTHQGRFSDMLKLVEATRDHLSIEQ